MNTPVFFGTDPTDDTPVIRNIERHLLTVAGSGAGKGVCQIIPNLRGEHAWPHSSLIVDPKGEAAELTAGFRANELGQTVAVVDPFYYARIQKKYRATINPLDFAHTVDDLYVLADGLVMRSGSEQNPHWNESAIDVIAGCLDFIQRYDPIPPKSRHLGLLRTILKKISEKNTREIMLQQMQDVDGLSANTAARLSNDNNEVSSILSTVQTQTRWLTSPDMIEALKQSALNDAPLDLNQLKWGKLSLYLVLPPDKLDHHGRFLRLFVRLMLSLMQQKHPETKAQKGTPCLFILDEFFSLGRISEIQKATGLMRSFGLHLWPFLQDWGQLEELYGTFGAQSFMGNADGVSCFGIGDFHTAETVSKWVGEITPEEIEDNLLNSAKDIERSANLNNFFVHSRQADQPLQTINQLILSRLDKARLPPDKLMQYLSKKDNDKVAQRMLVFRAGDAYEVIPTPHFYNDGAD